jgi:hypothetical protein
MPGYMNPGSEIGQGYGGYIPYSRYLLPLAYRAWGVPGWGRDFGRGRGMGFGYRGGRGGRWGVTYAGYGYGAPFAGPLGTAPTRKQKIESLLEQAKYFEDTLAEISKRIKDLEAESSKE